MSMFELTKQQAIDAMLAGKKVAHRHFSDNEYIYMKNGKIHDECHYNIDSEFWKYRNDISWENDWCIIS